MRSYCFYCWNFWSQAYRTSSPNPQRRTEHCFTGRAWELFPHGYDSSLIQSAKRENMVLLDDIASAHAVTAASCTLAQQYLWKWVQWEIGCFCSMKALLPFMEATRTQWSLPAERRGHGSKFCPILPPLLSSSLLLCYSTASPNQEAFQEEMKGFGKKL